MTVSADPVRADTAQVIAPPPLIYLIPLLVTLGIGVWQPWPVLAGAWPHLVGPAAIAIGVVLLWPSLAAFRAARTNPKPWKPSTTLVISGPYRYTRNPMYLGFTAVYLGVALWANSAWSLLGLLAVLPVMQRYVIRREERYLERTFGEPYRVYLRTVRRWI